MSSKYRPLRFVNNKPRDKIIDQKQGKDGRYGDNYDRPDLVMLVQNHRLNSVICFDQTSAVILLVATVSFL